MEEELNYAKKIKYWLIYEGCKKPKEVKWFAAYKTEEAAQEELNLKMK